MYFITYILYSKQADKYYIGFTGYDLEEGLRKHNSNHKGFTGKFNDWVVVYTEIFLEKGLAVNREKEIKNWECRKMLEKLIGV